MPNWWNTPLTPPWQMESKGDYITHLLDILHSSDTAEPTTPNGSLIAPSTHSLMKLFPILFWPILPHMKLCGNNAAQNHVRGRELFAASSNWRKWEHAYRSCPFLRTQLEYNVLFKSHWVKVRIPGEPWVKCWEFSCSPSRTLTLSKLLMLPMLPRRPRIRLAPWWQRWLYNMKHALFQLFMTNKCSWYRREGT